MASQLDNPPRPAMSAAASASVRQAAKVKGYVDQQLEKTRKQVKTIDLIAGLLVLVAFTVGFLTLAALIDAWIWPFSAFGRWVCLTLLIGGCIAYTAFAIVPLFLKRINPDYAAKMIEEAKPSFRNSLMNYVSLRKHPEEIKPAVLDAVSRQAATDLASVPSDAAVDQSKLIRLGFVLIALTLFAVGYKILSPKDPLQTVARILAPAGKIAQPAVVKIEDVQPGDVEIFFGEQLKVTATVAGSHRPEDVRLLYSTLDGQLTDQSISMVSDGTPNHYLVELSMAGGGIQSSLRYRVVARDGSSPDYEVIVRPNPSIAIESLVFNAPAYTKIPPRTLVGIGDIEAIEGTKVTVHALANLPIERATIELLNEVNDPNRPLGDIPYESRYKPAAAPIKMQFDGNSATGRISVTLDSSREKPFASHYRIRFTSTDGDRNQQPNVYPIRVIPDLAPEIEIRNPVQPNAVVPINGQLAIDVLASDLDFEIKSVSLNIDQQGKNLLAQKLELSSDDGNRRVTARYLLRPSELGLEVGDQAVFFAAAADNRISHASEQPDPNISRTQDFSLTVTDWNQQADEEMQQAKQDQANENPENADKENDKENDKEKKQNQSNQDQAGDGSKQADDSGDGKEGSNEGSNEGTEDGQQGESGNSGSEGNPSAQNEPGDSQGQGGGSSGEKPTGDSGEKQTGDEPSEGQGSGENSETKNSDQESSTGNQDSQGSGGPESSQNNQTPGDGNQGSDGESEPGDSSTGNQAPGESGSQDGGQGNQQDASAGPSTDNPSEGDMASDGSDGQKDDSLTDGSREQMAKNAPDGDRMKKLQELLGDDDEGDPESNDSEPSNDQSGDEKQPGDPSEANDSPGDEATNPGEDSQQPNESPSGSGDQSQKPGDGDQAQNAGNEEQQPGDGEQSPDQQPGESENQKGSNPSNSSDPSENGNKGSGSEQKSGNQSAADGKENPNKEDAPTDPRDDKNSTSEDSDNNDSPREQSSKPGMDDATGKQSQDPGGNETDKTGNESGGTDPGESNSAGNEAGQTEAGNNDSGNTESSDSEQANPSQGDSAESNPSDSGSKPGSEGQQSGRPENSQDENAQPGGKSGEGEQGKGDSSEGQPGESGKKSEGGKQSGKPAGGKPGGSQSQSSPSEGTNDSAAGGIGGDGSTTGELLEREKTNYEHAKKATDMVLKKLSEQRYDPDPELLEKMNWTQQDMEKFLRRWEEMKRAAEQGNPVAKKKYDKSLKSLGFRAPGGRRPAKELDETAEGLSEDSAVNRPSPERVRDYNSFLKDLNRRDNDK